MYLDAKFKVFTAKSIQTVIMVMTCSELCDKILVLQRSMTPPSSS
jgi:hypothetical protein